MEDRMTKVNRIVSRFDWDEFNKFEKWMRKKRDKMWEAERLKRKIEHEETIRALPAGTIVACTDSRSNLCGLKGRIIRHLGRGSSRTVVDFEEMGIWHVPRRLLITRIDKEKLNQLKMSRNLSGILNKALSKI